MDSEQLPKIEHVPNGDRGAFVVMQDDARQAEMTYSIAGEKRMRIDHTWVDESLRGQGMARHLLNDAVSYARENELQIVPVCSYVKAQFDRDASIRDVLAP